MLCFSVACAGVQKTRSDKPSVSFELPDLTGKTHTLKDYTGQVVLLDLWASWCVPCMQALPLYAEFQKEYGPRGFSVVTVSLDEEREALDDFVENFFKGAKPPYIILHDQEAKLAKQIILDTMPTSLIIDRSGQTVYLHTGFNRTKDEALYRAKIEKALAQ